MPAVAYATLAQVKESLAIATATTTFNVLIAEILLQVSDWFDTEIHATFESQVDVTEIHSGFSLINGIPLNCLPSEVEATRDLVIAVENGVTLSRPDDFGFKNTAGAKIPRVLYRFDGDGNPRGRNRWATGENNVQIIYTTAFETIPKDVERACIDESHRAFQAKNIKGFGDGGRIGIETRTPEAGTGLNYSVDDLSPGTVRMLDRYRVLFASP